MEEQVALTVYGPGSNGQLARAYPPEYVTRTSMRQPSPGSTPRIQAQAARVKPSPYHYTLANPGGHAFYVDDVLTIYHNGEEIFYGPAPGYNSGFIAPVRIDNVYEGDTIRVVATDLYPDCKAVDRLILLRQDYQALAVNAAAVEYNCGQPQGVFLDKTITIPSASPEVRIENLEADPGTFDPQASPDSGTPATTTITAEIQVENIDEPVGNYTLTIKPKSSPTAGGSPPPDEPPAAGRLAIQAADAQGTDPPPFPSPPIVGNLVRTIPGNLSFSNDTASVIEEWDGKSDSGDFFPEGDYEVDLRVTVTDGAGESKTAEGTATVKVGEQSLPEIAKIEALGSIPLLDDNGEPLSAVYWDGDTERSDPVAAAPGLPASASVARIGNLAVSQQTSFVVTKLKFTLRLPIGVPVSSSSQDFVYRGVIPALGDTATDPGTSQAVVPDFKVTFPANQREATQEAELRWSGGEVRSAKLTLYGRADADSSFTLSSYVIRSGSGVPELPKVYLPFAQPKPPLVGTRIPLRVMERACTYADGSANEDAARSKLTNGLFGWLCWQHGGYYSPDSGISYDRVHRTFNLEQFMNAPAEQCTATSAFLEVHCSAIGVGMQNQDIYPVTGSGFRTRSIAGWGYTRWGRNPTTSEFPTFPNPAASPRFVADNFIFHQTCVATGKVYELSFAVPGPSLLAGLGLSEYVSSLSDPGGRCRTRSTPFQTRTVWMESR